MDNAPLLAAAREAFKEEPRFVFAEPVIAGGPGGHHGNSLSAREFAAWERGGRFALTWLNCGTSYGLKREVVSQVNAGSVVIADLLPVSLAEARREFQSRLAVIAVTAPRQARAARLARSLPDRAATQPRRFRRIDFAAMPGLDFIVVDGDRGLEEALQQFIDAIRLFAR